MYLHVMLHAGHCVDPKVALRPAVGDVDVAVVGGGVVAAIVLLEARKTPSVAVTAVAEVKPASPLVPHLNLGRAISSLDTFQRHLVSIQHNIKSGLMAFHLSAVVEPDAEADDEAENDDGRDDDADDDGHVDALAGVGGGGGQVDVLEEGYEAEGEAAALRVRRVRPLETALGGGPVVPEEINENSNQHFWPNDLNN